MQHDLKLWEEIVHDVDVVAIPLEVVNYIDVQPDGHDEPVTIDLDSLRGAGKTEDEIEHFVRITVTAMAMVGGVTLDYSVDCGRIADIVQPMVDKLFEGLV